MEKLKAIVRQLEFHLLLFLTGVILFVQPLSVATTRSSPNAVLWRLFVSWGVVIVLLFLVSRAYRTRLQDDEGVGRPGADADLNAEVREYSDGVREYSGRVLSDGDRGE